MTASYSQLAAVLEGRYGVSLLVAPAVSILWAAERLVETHGAEVARAELSAANRRREQCGKVPAYPEYGAVLFGSPARQKRIRRVAVGA